MRKLNNFIFLVFLSCFTINNVAQHLYQQPKPLKEKSKLFEIIGPIISNETEKDINIIWVYGYDENHIAGAHDYVKIKDLMIDLLSMVKTVHIEEAFHFPSDEQMDNADLLIMYLHLPQLKNSQFTIFKNFVKKGGGVISLHETAIMRPADKGKLLSECLGFAWNEGISKWGAIFDEVKIDNEHIIFKGFPNKLTITDEFYWDLHKEEAVEILGSVRTGPDGDSDGPIDEQFLSKEESPVMWVYQIGEGKVFGTTAGHHTFTYFDPEFRIMLFRAIAWVANEKPDPFMQLVFEGITNEDGLVGITNDLRNWKGKIRQ